MEQIAKQLLKRVSEKVETLTDHKITKVAYSKSFKEWRAYISQSKPHWEDITWRVKEPDNQGNSEIHLGFYSEMPSDQLTISIQKAENLGKGIVDKIIENDNGIRLVWKLNLNDKSALEKVEVAILKLLPEFLKIALESLVKPLIMNPIDNVKNEVEKAQTEKPKKSKKENNDDFDFEQFEKIRIQVEEEFAQQTEAINFFITNFENNYFFHFPAMVNHAIEHFGEKIVLLSLKRMTEENSHFEINSGMLFLSRKYRSDDNYFDNFPNLSNDVYENLEFEVDFREGAFMLDYVAKKRELKTPGFGFPWALLNSNNTYIVRDLDSFKKFNGPVGLAIRFCSCETFAEVVEENLLDEFKKHFMNIYFWTLENLDEITPEYLENLSSFLACTIDSLYHEKDGFNLELSEGILANSMANLLYYTYGIVYNSYFTEEPIEIDTKKLELFGVEINYISYPYDFESLASDLRVKILG